MTGGMGLDNSAGGLPPQAVSLSPMEILSIRTQSNSSSGLSGENVVVSPFGELILALTQAFLQNETVFKQSAAQAATRLQNEAEQNARNAEQKQFLVKVANALQQASETGQMPQLPSLPTTSFQAYSKTGQPSAVTPSPQSTQVFSSLANQVNAAVQSLSQLSEGQN